MGISKWKDTFLLDPTIPEDQGEIANRFNVITGWKENVDGQTEDMEDNVCTKYFSILYLCKTIGIVPFDLHFVEERHRYAMFLYLRIMGRIMQTPIALCQNQ